MPDESILGGGNALRVCGRPGLPKIPLSDPARPLRQQSFLDLLAQVVDIVHPHQDLDAVQIVDACCRLTPEFSCSVR